MTPAARILTSVIAIIGIVVASLRALLLIGLILTLLTIAMGAFRYTVRRILVVLPLLIMLVAVHPFTHEGREIVSLFGLSMTDEGVLAALRLFLRIVLSLTVASLLLYRMDEAGLIRGLADLRVPYEIVMIVALMTRYIRLLRGELHTMIMAQKARCFDLRDRRIPLRRKAEVLASTIGMLFVRTSERAEHIYMGMISRGFGRGSISYRSGNFLNSCDLILIGLTLAFFILIDLIL